MYTICMFVEDYIDVLLGFKDGKKFDIELSDSHVLLSIGKQSLNGVGLTDRQLVLVKRILNSYSQQLIDNGYTDLDFTNTKLPLREINRSRWIKISKEKIAVRFIFNKKLISVLEDLRLKGIGSDYNKQEKIHYYTYNEKTLYAIVNAFKDKHFDIEENIISTFEILENMTNNKKDYIPGIYNYKLKNLKQKAIDIMVSSIGEPSTENLALYKDRQDKYGLCYFDEEELNKSTFNLTSLTKKIVERKKNHVLIKPDNYTIDNVVESVLELHRFPILVLVNEAKALDTIVECQQRFKNIIPNEDVSVLFRKDNDKVGKQFNEYIRNNNLNNTLDNNTKIVYISNNKLPKPLLKSDWKASLVWSFESERTNAKIVDYLNEFDLVIHYDNNKSYMLRNLIETI